MSVLASTQIGLAGLRGSDVAASNWATKNVRQVVTVSINPTGTKSGNSEAADSVSFSSEAAEVLSGASIQSNSVKKPDSSANLSKVDDVYQALAAVIDSKDTTNTQKLEAYKAYTLDSDVRDTTLGHLQYAATSADFAFWNAIQNSSIAKGESDIARGLSDGSALESGIASINAEKARLDTENLNGLLSAVSSSISISVSAGGGVSVSFSISKLFKPASEVPASAGLWDGSAAAKAGAETATTSSSQPVAELDTAQSKAEDALLILETYSKSRLASGSYSAKSELPPEIAPNSHAATITAA